ncbi:MAG TPA: hypothetical protein VM536_02435 [Chloroflexia bacterium]|nr:hypothetical protein [Chloroflexia bacterium]
MRRAAQYLASAQLLLGYREPDVDLWAAYLRYDALPILDVADRCFEEPIELTPARKEKEKTHG